MDSDKRPNSVLSGPALPPWSKNQTRAQFLPPTFMLICGPMTCFGTVELNRRAIY